MDEFQKNAYRLLLCDAMNETRDLQWLTDRPYRLLNPIRLIQKLRSASRAGGLANWLQDLAHSSAEDFRYFDEQRFWQEYDKLESRHPCRWRDYREAFEGHLADFRNADVLDNWDDRERLLQERRAIALEKLAAAGSKDDKILVDPIEDDSAMQTILREADRLADAELARQNRGLGFCHQFWRTKQRILKKQFNVAWFSPAEMDPSSIFD
jgi:hypothetical protein